MLFQEFLGQPRCFPTEHQVIVGLKLHFRVMLRPARLDEPKLRGEWERSLKLLPAFPTLPIHLFPVVHPSALELLVVELEAERFDEMQRCPCRGAEACNV